VNTSHARNTAAFLVALALVGCGGGGGGGSGGNTPSPAPVAPSPTPTIVVTVTPSGPIQQTFPTGDPVSVALTGRVTATNLASGSVVYLKLRDTTNTYRVPAAQPAAVDQSFRVEIPPSPNHTAGNYAGQFEITPCGDGQCTKILGPAVRVDYSLYVTLLGEWEGYQRDSAHAGYVPTSLDPSRLQLMWNWVPPRDAAAVGAALSRPATDPDSLFVVGSSVMLDGSEQSPAVYGVGAYNGKVRWSHAIAPTAHAVAPSTSTGTVYATTLNDPTLVTGLESATGAVRFRYSQSTLPSAAILSPTTYGQSVFFAGPNGEEIHSISSHEGRPLWARPRVGLQVAMPALDAAHVIYQAGGTIEVLNARDGSPVASLVDPASDGAAYPGPTAVVLGTHGNAIVNSYNATQGSSRLSSFHIENRRHEWSTSQSYRPLFAVGDGVIYANRRNAPVPTLDAIDENSGQVLWSWTPPTVEAQTAMVGNILLTRNLVFFSTEGAGGSFVWAVDRATRQEVWRYPGGGYVVMSGNRTFYIVSGPFGAPLDYVRGFREMLP